MLLGREPMNSGDSWDIHVHAVPAEIVKAAHDGRFGMCLDNNVLNIRGERLTITELVDAQGIRDNRRALSNQLVVSVPPALLRYDLDYECAAEWACLVNDGLRRICEENGIFGFAYLPVQFPDLAIQEIGRIWGAPFVGYVFGTSIGERMLDDKVLNPVYEVLNTIKAFVFVHPLKTPDKRLNRYYLDNLLGNPVETGISIAHLIFSGRLIEYQDIRFCFAHGGGVAAQLAGRWQHGYETRRPGLKVLEIEPRELLSRLYVDTIVHDSWVLRLCMEVFGKEHILPGTDFPFPMGESLVSSSFDKLSVMDKELILYYNVPALLNLCNVRME